MNLTPEILEEIEKLSALAEYTPDMVAEVMQIPREQMLEHPELIGAFRKGKLLSRAHLDKKIEQLAHQGSSPAQSILVKLHKEQEIDAMREYYG